MNRNPPTDVPDQGDCKYRKEDQTPTTPDRYPLQDDPMGTSPELPATQKSGTFGRGRPKLIGNREESTSPEKRPGTGKSKQLGPLTINADQMSDSDFEQIISDTQQSGRDLHIKDTNGKITYNTFEKRIE